jgi:hypothetical protein
MRELHISKSDLRDVRIVDVAEAPLAEGAARLKLDLFALTANNITYAAMGAGVLGYWDFFPGPEGWGKVPVWGFATVTQSNVQGVEVGQHYYGYYPLAETLDVLPTRASQRGFADSAAHRAPKAAIYNQYLNTAADPAYDAAFEPEQTLFRPLYATGWWAADCIAQGKPRVAVLSSASSKTALATAHALRKRGGVETVGLTSARNVDYVRSAGLYDRTLSYDAVSELSGEGPSVYVDFLGRDELTAAVHRALGAGLTRSILIGATDWDDKAGGVAPPKPDLVGPKPEFFFVPSYAAGRLQAQPELGAAMLDDLRAFYPASRALVRAQRPRGEAAIVESWARLAAGDVAPDEGLVLSF